jgi:hypothetical protein
MDKLKNNWRIISILLATIILGTVVVFTALRLYSLREKLIALTIPTPSHAAEPCVLSFTVSAAGTTPTETPSLTPTPTSSYYYPTATPTTAAFFTPTSSIEASPTSQAKLPEAGFTLPTFALIAVGTLLAIFGLIFVL